MASQLESELKKLKNAIIKISNLAENQVIEAMKALLSEPAAQGKEVKKTENKIDKLDVKIDEICQNVFALQQPVASDLRFIMSAMQISNEVERIGDLALDVIKNNKNIKEKHDLILRHNIPEITKEVEEIVLKTILCFQNLNPENISEVFVLNSAIKTKSAEAIQGIINEMKDNSKTVVSGTSLVLVLKNIERISEHCTNVAESVYFMINAEIIKNGKK
ncbi:MAG: phosphate signaling complex protein PhoU [Flavobacterium sp.]